MFYKTVRGYGEAKIEEKKSKFIAYVQKAETEEYASLFVTSIKKKNYDATHNVFAYSIGINEGTVKANDDGEPSGTAGMPILDLLRKEKIKNCVIVVTRYFGGTLLGTGGLVRAYGRAAKEGLLSAGIIERTLCTRYELTVDYSTYGKIQYHLEKDGYRLPEIIYEENVKIIIKIEEQRKDEFVKLVSAICQGQQTLVETDAGYYDFIIM